MSPLSPPPPLTTPIDAARQVAQFRHLLRLIEGLAGLRPAPAADEAALDEAAKVSSAYADALPIVQRRFEALAAETAVWSAAGVEALLAAGEERNPAAARRLADELAKALNRLTSLLRL